MKLYAALFHVVAILAWAGSALGDDKPAVCPVKPDADEDETARHITELALGCLEANGGDLSLFAKAVGAEDRGGQFKAFCDSRGPITECLSGVARTSEACQNSTRHGLTQMDIRLLEATLEAGCVRDGQAVASIVTEYFNPPSGPFESDPFRDCILTGKTGLSRLVSTDLEVSSRFYILYRAAINIKECFADIADDGEHRNTLTADVISIMSEVIDKISCVHPADESAVTCASIDITLAEVPRLCPIRSVDEGASPMLDIIVGRISWCLTSSLPVKDERVEDEGVEGIKDLETSRAYVRQNCNRRAIVDRCLSDVAALSSVCLDETQRNVAGVVEEVTRQALGYACTNHGRSVANALLKVVNDSRDRTNRTANVLLECMMVAKQEHELETTELGAAMFLDLYRQLDIFKGCFEGKMRGDNTAVYQANTFVALIQRNAKCLSPEDGSVVLCETIVPTSTAKECPFVGENGEDGPPEHEMFVDLGFACLKASTVEGVDDIETLEESRKLAGSFCRGRKTVGQCLDALVATSEPCGNHTRHQLLLILADFVNTATEVGCRQDGEVFATLLHGLSGEVTNQTSDCLEGVSNPLRDAGSGVETAAAKSVRAYRAFESMGACFRASEVGSAEAPFTLFLNEILRSLKCIHPDDGTLVLCETIINN